MLDKPTEPTPAALLETAQRLEAALPALRGDIADLRGYGHRNRLLIWVLTGISALLLACTAGTITALVRADESRDQVSTVQDYLRVACPAANEQRTAQRQLWAYALELPQSKKVSKAQRERLGAFRAYVNEKFADRDCSQVDGH